MDRDINCCFSFYFVCFYINKLSLHCDSKAGVSNIRPKMCDKIGLAQTPVRSNYYRTVWAMLYTFCFTHHTDLGNRFLSFSRVTLLSYAAKLRHTVETALFTYIEIFQQLNVQINFCIQTQRKESFTGLALSGWKWVVSDPPCKMS